MEIILCAVQPYLAKAWREHISDDLSRTVRVVEGSILSLDVAAVVSPANSFGFMDGGLDALYTQYFGPQLQQRLQRMIREQAGGELLVGQALLVETGHPHIRWCISANCAAEIFPSLTARMKRWAAPLVLFESDEARAAFYKKADMKSPNEYLVEAKRAKGLGKIQFLLLAGKVNEAVAEAITRLKVYFSRPTMNFCEASTVLDLVQFARLNKDAKDNSWYELIACSYYLAAYKAMWRGYGLIIEYLVSCFEKIVSEKGITWLAPRVSELKLVCALTLAKNDSKAGKAYASSHCGGSQAGQGIQSLADNTAVDGGSTVKMRDIGVVPVEINELKFTSVCSGKTIRGSTFFLEDPKYVMGGDEAQMWFEVTPFSPLETHEQMMTY